MSPETLLELLRSRRSVRAFTDRPVDRATLDRLIEAAQWAPSNHNRQGWKFIIFQDRGQIADLAARVGESLERALASANRLVAAQGQELLHFGTLFANAPVAILALHKKSPAIGRALLGQAGRTLSAEALSTAMGVQNMLLAAHAMGLGACVMTAPLLAGEVWQAADLPAGFEPTCLVAAGYPAGQPTPPRRKAIDHIVEYR